MVFQPSRMLLSVCALGACGVAVAAPLGAANDLNQSYPYTINWRTPQVDPRFPIEVLDPLSIKNPIPMIVAGDPNGTPPDSPANRVDANTAGSPFAGVVSLVMGGQFLCTGAPISRRHILTAGHCFDANNVGVNSFGTNVVIRFNNGSGLTITSAGVAAVDINPNFSGFANPAVNDDLTIITLTADLPLSIPIYPPFRGTVTNGDFITMVGYGLTGDAINGYAGGATTTVKRSGANAANQFFGNDDPGPAALEVWQFDFDGPNGNGFAGGPTLGNDVETVLGGGDSGGPGFIDVAGQLQAYSVNTFGFGNSPFFGSGGGGILVNGYLPWIDSFIGPPPPPPCTGDLNGDLQVGSGDLAILLGTWGSAAPAGDLDNSGSIGAGDLAIMLGLWGPCP